MMERETQAIAAASRDAAILLRLAAIHLRRAADEPALRRFCLYGAASALVLAQRELMRVRRVLA